MKVPVDRSDVVQWLANEFRRQRGACAAVPSPEIAWRELVDVAWYGFGPRLAWTWDFAWYGEIYDPLANAEHCVFPDAGEVIDVSLEEFCEQVTANCVKFVPEAGVGDEAWRSQLVAEAAEYAVERCGGRDLAAAQVMQAAVRRSLPSLDDPAVLRTNLAQWNKQAHGAALVPASLPFVLLVAACFVLRDRLSPAIVWLGLLAFGGLCVALPSRWIGFPSVDRQAEYYEQSLRRMEALVSGSQGADLAQD